MDESLNGTPGYVQFEYISEQMRDLFAISSIVISRAGANAICELLALKKPNLLIPLSAMQAAATRFLMPILSRSMVIQWFLQKRI